MWRRPRGLWWRVESGYEVAVKHLSCATRAMYDVMPLWLHTLVVKIFLHSSSTSDQVTFFLIKRSKAIYMYIESTTKVMGVSIPSPSAGAASGPSTHHQNHDKIVVVGRKVALQTKNRRWRCWTTHQLRSDGTKKHKLKVHQGALQRVLDDSWQGKAQRCHHYQSSAAYWRNPNFKDLTEASSICRGPHPLPLLEG